MALSSVGGALAKVRAQTSPSDTILHKGMSSGPSKQQGLKCGGQDICQAKGLTHLFGGTLGCVDKNGENIPASSCSAGVEEDTENLKCGDNCFVACQDGRTEVIVSVGQDAGTCASWLRDVFPLSISSPWTRKNVLLSTIRSRQRVLTHAKVII